MSHKCLPPTIGIDSPAHHQQTHWPSSAPSIHDEPAAQVAGNFDERRQEKTQILIIAERWPIIAQSQVNGFIGEPIQCDQQRFQSHIRRPTQIQCANRFRCRFHAHFIGFDAFMQFYAKRIWQHSLIDTCHHLQYIQRFGQFTFGEKPSRRLGHHE